MYNIKKIKIIFTNNNGNLGVIGTIEKSDNVFQIHDIETETDYMIPMYNVKFISVTDKK